MLIIAMFVLSLNGCGYKAPPYYLEEVSSVDEDIEFIIKSRVNNAV